MGINNGPDGAPRRHGMNRTCFGLRRYPCRPINRRQYRRPLTDAAKVVEDANQQSDRSLKLVQCLTHCKHKLVIYTVFQKKTPTHIVGYKLMNSCLILIIFDTTLPDII